MENTGCCDRKRDNPGCLLQLLWFAFIGVWLGQAWMVVAWIFMVTTGSRSVLQCSAARCALREPAKSDQRAARRGFTREIEPPQVNILLRASISS